MSLPKPTLRRSGRRAITLSVKHHLYEENIVQMVAFAISRMDYEFTSKADLERYLRRQLLDSGTESSAYWADEVEDGEADEIRERAQEIVRRLMPGFCKE